MTKSITTCIGSALLLVSISVKGQEPQSLYQNNREPLLSKPFIELPLGAVKPEGWLKDQMLRMKNGMTGVWIPYMKT
jgi:hypothetical protein